MQNHGPDVQNRVMAADCVRISYWYDLGSFGHLGFWPSRALSPLPGGGGGGHLSSQAFNQPDSSDDVCNLARTAKSIWAGFKKCMEKMARWQYCVLGATPTSITFESPGGLRPSGPPHRQLGGLRPPDPPVGFGGRSPPVVSGPPGTLGRWWWCWGGSYVQSRWQRHRTLGPRASCPWATSWWL